MYIKDLQSWEVGIIEVYGVSLITYIQFHKTPWSYNVIMVLNVGFLMTAAFGYCKLIH